MLAAVQHSVSQGGEFTGDGRYIVSVDALHDLARLLIYRRRIHGAKDATRNRSDRIGIAADVRRKEDGVFRRWRLMNRTLTTPDASRAYRGEFAS